MANDMDLFPEMFRTGGEPKKTLATMQRFAAGVTSRNVAYTELGGNAIFEGDIVLGTIEEVEAAQAKAESKGIGIVGDKFRWPDGIIPFVITAESTRQRVEGAIAHWQSLTPLRFVPRITETAFISFESLDGCFSRVGHQGTKQVISLAPGCGLGSAIHEIGHAVGLWHEQSRSDRDQHITILLDNVQDNAKHNFDKHVQDGKDWGKYDFGSIMHYPATAFSKNGQVTIRTKNGEAIGQRNGLSRGDLFAVKQMYDKLDWSNHPVPE